MAILPKCQFQVLKATKIRKFKPKKVQSLKNSASFTEYLRRKISKRILFFDHKRLYENKQQSEISTLKNVVRVKNWG